MLLYFLLPILCNALLLAACKLPKLAPAGSEFSKTAVRMGILTAGEILVLLLLHALIRGFQITGSHLYFLEHCPLRLPYLRNDLFSFR